MEYGYVRVSTREQNEERQVIAMHEFGMKTALNQTWSHYLSVRCV